MDRLFNILYIITQSRQNFYCFNNNFTFMDRVSGFFTFLSGKAEPKNLKLNNYQSLPLPILLVFLLACRLGAPTRKAKEKNEKITILPKKFFEMVPTRAL